MIVILFCRFVNKKIADEREYKKNCECQCTVLLIFRQITCLNSFCCTYL